MTEPSKVCLLMIARCATKKDHGKLEKGGKEQLLVSGPQYGGHVTCDSGAEGLVSVHLLRSHLRFRSGVSVCCH